MQLCKCSNQFKFDESETTAGGPFVSRELSAKLRDGESKLLQGSIHEAQLSLREALSFNNEEARALLGRLEYERGNYEAALEVLEGVQGHTFGATLRFFIADFKTRQAKKGSRQSSKEGSNSGKDGTVLGTFLHGASLILEALYLKAKCLQELDQLPEAIHECKLVLDTMETAIPAGLPDEWGRTRMADMLSRSVILLPELLLQTNPTSSSEAVTAYRRSLLRFSWCLSSQDLVHIMKSFAVLLLYGGLQEDLPPPLRASHSHHSHVQAEGATIFMPKNNTEEGILLLMILLRIMNKSKDGYFDGSVFEHLAFALSVDGQTETLAHQYEALLPGTVARPERWYSLALCYSAAAGSTSATPLRALELLRKSLAVTERPNDVPALLMAAKLCVAAAAKAGKESEMVCEEGVLYAKRVVANLDDEAAAGGGSSVGLRARALHVQGVAARSLVALQDAAALDGGDCSIIFDLGLALAEHKQTGMAMDCAKWCLDRGSVQGWRFLALVLTSQERHAEADAVLESALEVASTREQGPLLRTRAKVQMALGRPLRAVKSYQSLLALLRTQHQLSGGATMMPGKVTGQNNVEEAEVWHDLAQVYAHLKQWHDAETCLDKARSFESFAVATWHHSGMVHEEQGEVEKAMVCYKNALALDPGYTKSKVKLGAAMLRLQGRVQCKEKGKGTGVSGGAMAVARSYLAEALQAEPSHVEAWYHMGLLHKAAGRKREAAACFHEAVVHEQCSPVEPFSSITPALLSLW